MMTCVGHWISMIYSATLIISIIVHTFLLLQQCNISFWYCTNFKLHLFLHNSLTLLFKFLLILFYKLFVTVQAGTVTYFWQMGS